jgi:hypothetical protein
MSSLSRRAFLKMATAFTAFGAAAWVSDVSDVETSLVIGVDPAEPEGDETVSSPDLEQPFAPYFIGPISISVGWDEMENGDTWGLPNERED